MKELAKSSSELYIESVLYNLFAEVKELMAVVKILSKGQIVIPAEIRKRYNLEPGKEIQIMEYGGIIYLIPPVEDPINAACGVLPPKPSLSEKLLRERKSEFR